MLDREYSLELDEDRFAAEVIGLPEDDVFLRESFFRSVLALLSTSLAEDKLLITEQ